VYLEPTSRESVRAGSLLRDQAGTVTFVVDEGYIERGPTRPVLSLAYHAITGEEETTARLRQRQDKVGSVTTLPPFFANLLPEGALRAVVEAQLPPGDNHEFGMLRRLGGDLPGAVVIREEQTGEVVPAPARVTASDDNAALVKFSLAGVQMKFSMVAAGDRLTLPARGETGKMIVKLPSRDYPDLPEIEFGAMTLAKAAGVETAEIRLVPIGYLEGLKEDFTRYGRNALAVSRFDRTGERRVHMEDFAQILGAVGNQKYSKANVETMARLCARFTPDPNGAVLEMVRRIVVDLMLGNGDNHLKNSTFLYPDGRTPTLSPAYDIVPTVFFQPRDELALSFGGKRSFERITTHEFDRMAGYVEVSARAIMREVEKTIERASDAWPKMMADLPWPKSVTRTLAARWSKLALFEGRRNPFD
jgi:serine/threonine-protein kinase HipA